MCGGGDEPERKLWRAAHLSKRMAQLRAILDTVGDDLATKSGVRHSFRMLAEAQQRDPRMVGELLSSPQTGAWAATCLRLLASREPDGPVWPHLAHLGSVAAVAALRAGQRVRVMVPVHAGAVHLPTFGRASLATTESLVECDTDPGLRFDGAEPAAWEAVHTLHSVAGGVPLAVQLDDVDLYWSSFDMPTTGRLTNEEVAVWQDRIDEAWAILGERHPHRLHTLAAALRCLVPIRQDGRIGGVSASSVDAPGAVALTEPTSPVRLAATLIHESQHYRLASLHDLRHLYTTPPAQLRYSPWRNDPRPVSGVVHGLMAFAGVADFWSRERVDLPTELEYARHVRQLRVAYRVASAASDLTELGRALVAALGTAIDAMPVDTGPEDVRRVADDLVNEHEARWRLRTIVPSPEDVRAFGEAWLAGTSLPIGHATPPAAGAPSGDNPVTRVAMALLEGRFERQELGDVQFSQHFPGAAPYHVPLVAGDYRVARDDALAHIGADPADDAAWATLSVACGRLSAEPDRSPVVRVPELVRAAFAVIAPDGDLRPLRALLAR